MKKTLTMYCAIAFLLTALQLPAQVGINSDNSSPDQSAGLEVKFNNKGFLPPRLTQAQISSIANPANGLIVFCTTDNKCYVYISTAVAWKELLFGTGTIIPTSCGNQIVDTRDGKIYNTVLIGNQCWMAQNLNIGTKITGPGFQTNNGTIEKWCHNDNDASCAIYGGLYQWDELM
ncbi:MAG: hypothetical protein NTW16_03900, partial [Bacteroidetes bacterium]|nr:hypothetical protein [Bacteroidota bacterium]